jgi:hypothetical protein
MLLRRPSDITKKMTHSEDSSKDSKESDDIVEKVPEKAFEISSGMCCHCKRRSHLLFDCKCNRKYCSKHLQPEVHNCGNIDQYRRRSADIINNKVLKDSVKADKVPDRI